VPPSQPIWIVIVPGGIILGAYTAPDSAHLHSRVVTGAEVVVCELLEQVPASVRDDLAVDFDDDDDTPVVGVPITPRRRS
jgi:hypothetical protein